MVNITKGFTLIEIMIVVAIIGILASVAIESLNRYKTNAPGEIMEDDTRMDINGVLHTCDQYGVCVPDD